MSQAPPVTFKLLRPDAVAPRYMSEHAAGLDLAAALDGPVTLAPGARAAIGTGLAMALPPGFEGQVRPRSGLATRHGLTIPNAPGTIDADYRGELFVALINLGREPVEIGHGDRVAQLVIAPVARAAVIVAEQLGGTGRGAGGFGSTGISGPVSVRGAGARQGVDDGLR